MPSLSESEKRELLAPLSNGEAISERWRMRLFPSAAPAVEVGKEYRLAYDRKMKREEVLAQTPAAPWQLVRSFCAERPHADGWRNLLVWGDNLLAMRELLADHQGPNRFSTRGKIKLILVVEVKADDDDANRNKAKCRDGLKHFEMLNQRLKDTGEPWRYHFFFLSPEDNTRFFEQVRNKSYGTWRSALMQELIAS